MSYIQKTWQAGDVIRSADLNNIEEGIAEAMESGGNTEPLYVTITVDDSGEEPEYSANKTIAQIKAAYDAHQDVIVLYPIEENILMPISLQWCTTFEDGSEQFILVVFSDIFELEAHRPNMLTISGEFDAEGIEGGWFVSMTKLAERESNSSNNDTSPNIVSISATYNPSNQVWSNITPFSTSLISDILYGKEIIIELSYQGTVDIESNDVITRYYDYYKLAHYIYQAPYTNKIGAQDGFYKFIFDSVYNRTEASSIEFKFAINNAGILTPDVPMFYKNTLNTAVLPTLVVSGDNSGCILGVKNQNYALMVAYDAPLIDNSGTLTIDTSDTNLATNSDQAQFRAYIKQNPNAAMWLYYNGTRYACTIASYTEDAGQSTMTAIFDIKGSLTISSSPVSTLTFNFDWSKYGTTTITVQ